MASPFVAIAAVNLLTVRMAHHLCILLSATDSSRMNSCALIFFHSATDAQVDRELIHWKTGHWKTFNFLFINHSNVTHFPVERQTFSMLVYISSQADEIKFSHSIFAPCICYPLWKKNAVPTVGKRKPTAFDIPPPNIRYRCGQC